MQIIKKEITSDFRLEITVYHKGKTYLREVAGLLYWFVKDNDIWNHIKGEERYILEKEFNATELALNRQKKLERIIK